MKPQQTLMSLSDIARLAQVQRPVVSMWISRSGQLPFPTPISTVEGQPRFDAQDVAAYLAATSRGKNPEAADDLAAHVHLSSITSIDVEVAVDGLTALLCLGAMSAESLGDLDRSTLVALADELDPTDTLLFREVRALGAQLEPLAAHAEALADASYSASAAFELLLRRHRSQCFPGLAAVALQPAALELVARTARGLAGDAGMGAPLFTDPTDSSGDLLLAR